MTTMNRTEARFDAKHRAVVPGALMAAAGLDYSQALVIVAEPGRLVIEDREASLARIREDILSMVRPPADDPTRDAVADVRAMRDEDNEISERNSARRTAEAEQRSPEESEAHGRALLDALGL
jgi:hypothetical protein